MRRYVRTRYRGLLVLAASGVVPILVALPFRVFWFPESDPNTWLSLLILGPATEEAAKLTFLIVLSMFANLGRIWLYHRTQEPDRARFLSPAFLLLILPVASGLFNGLWEHFGFHASEPPDRILWRLAAGAGSACTAFVTCLFRWRKGSRPALGLWIGTLAGMAPHAVFNFERVAALEGIVIPPSPYQPVVALLWLAVAIALLSREVKNEPGSLSAHLLAADLGDANRRTPGSGPS
jgi:hypothetical protein